MHHVSVARELERQRGVPGGQDPWHMCQGS
jgi:hypothetical protein